jgi:hypothetical protein
VSSSHEAFDNTVATSVDVPSIMVAYAVGIHRFNFLVGLAYAFFDALVVVWMRKPLSGFVRHVVTSGVVARALRTRMWPISPKHSTSRTAHSLSTSISILIDAQGPMPVRTWLTFW